MTAPNPVQRRAARARAVLCTDWKVAICALVLLAIAGAVSGCSTTPKPPDTRIVCTINRDRAFTLNPLKWFNAAYGFELAEADRELICAAPMPVSKAASS
jgi:hypothetical protein